MDQPDCAKKDIAAPRISELRPYKEPQAYTTRNLRFFEQQHGLISSVVPLDSLVRGRVMQLHDIHLLT